MSAAAQPLAVVEDATEFSLRDVIRGVLAESTEASPVALAPLVAERIPDHELRTVLAALLPEAIRLTIGEERRHVHRRQGGASSKWAEAQSVLVQRVSVGSGWKFLGECTAMELVQIVDRYRDAARDNIEQAQRYKRLLERMQERKAATVADLGEVQVEALLK